jgi:metal-responsive CopG/Arc/MetJ family transcriptional regulator
VSRNKVAITINQHTIDRVDKLESQHILSSRSRAFEEALEGKLNKLDKSRLARECARLHLAFEKTLAEEGLSGEIDECPKY